MEVGGRGTSWGLGTRGEGRGAAAASSRRGGAGRDPKAWLNASSSSLRSRCRRLAEARVPRARRPYLSLTPPWCDALPVCHSCITKTPPWWGGRGEGEGVQSGGPGSAPRCNNWQLLGSNRAVGRPSACTPHHDAEVSTNGHASRSARECTHLRTNLLGSPCRAPPAPPASTPPSAPPSGCRACWGT